MSGRPFRPVQRRRRLVRAALCLLVIALWPRPAFAQAAGDAALRHPAPYDPPAQYTDAVRSSHYLTMADGVKIAVDVLLPDRLPAGVRVPAILRQTRYWRSLVQAVPVRSPLDEFAGALGRLAEVRRRFIEQGYAWVDVDVRGSGASHGTRHYELSPEEIRDGAAVVDWIVAQPWSNGSVGAMGISYDGTTAELLLLNRHPAVRAVAPLFSLFDVYADIAFPGGIHASWFIENWGGVNALLDQNRVPDPIESFANGVRPIDADTSLTLLAAALRDHADNGDIAREVSAITFRDDPPASSAFASLDALSPHAYAAELTASGAAVYGISGWLDGAYPYAAIKRFRAVPNPGSRLLIGPWAHGGEENISPFGPGPARFDFAGELLKFFDFHLKGIDTGISRERPVHYFTLGAEEWQHATTWPPPASDVVYYFDAAGRLSLDRPRVAEAADPYRIELTAGTGPRSRWRSLLGVSTIGAYADRAAQDAKLLRYTSSPLERDTEVTGHPVVYLHVRSSAQDGAFFVYLEDVDERGNVTYVTEGMLRALHRKPAEREGPEVGPVHTFLRADALPLVPGELAELAFGLLPVSYVFKKGHRIRVALAGADRDYFAAPPGEAPTVRVHRDRAHASRIVLPVVRGR